MRHKHADVIHAWAEGIPIEVSMDGEVWAETDKPTFGNSFRYRTKPTPNHDEQTDNHSGICLEVEA